MSHLGMEWMKGVSDPRKGRSSESAAKMLAKPGEDGSWVTLATDIIHNQKGQEVFLHIPTLFLHVILIFRKVTLIG